MIPAGTFAALFLIALVPAWLHQTLRGNLRPRPRKASEVREFLELLAFGVVTTGVSGAAVLLIPHDWMPFLIDVDRWGADGTKYLRAEPRHVLASAVSVLGLAGALAVIAYRVEARFTPESSRHENTAWGQALGAAPAGKAIWAGIMLRDGTLVEGLLHSYDRVTGLEGPARDLALLAPIRVTRPSKPARTLQLDRFVVSSAEIAYITALHLAPPQPT